jgi:L-malate glycosyltransferase
MRICYIGLADPYAGNISRRMIERGHNVHLITWGFMGGSDNPKTYGNDWGGVKVHYLGGGHPKVSKWLIPLTAFRVRRIIATIEPDVVQSFYLLPYSLYGVLSGFHPHIASAWGSDVMDATKNKLTTWVTRAILRRSDRIHSVATHLTKDCIDLGARPEKIFTTPIGVDMGRFKPLNDKASTRKKFGLAEGPLIISTRSLEPAYGIETLVRAAPLVLDKFPRAGFIIVGNGSQKSELEGLANSLGITSKIQFIGWLPNEYYPDFIGSADIYVSTSRSDGYSASLIEALAVGLYPVVSDIQPNRAIFSDKLNGKFFPVGDAEALASCITAALNELPSAETVLNQDIKYVREKASIDRTIETLEEVYLSIKNKRV